MTTRIASPGAAVLATTVAMAVSGCVAVPAAPRPRPDVSPLAARAAQAALACQARPAPPGPIIIRTSTPGRPTWALRTGDVWFMAPTIGCVTSVEWLMDVPPPTGCVEVGYTADNPGYPAAAMPAAPLRTVYKSAGPGCTDGSAK